MDKATLINTQAQAVMASSVVEQAWGFLEKVLWTSTGPSVMERNPAFWIPRADYDAYFTETIQEEPLLNASGRVASRSCLLSFLSAIRMGRAGFPGIYASIGAYYRHESVVTPGVRECVFPQLEIEVLDPDPQNALGTTLNLLGEILWGMGCAEYEVRIQGTLPPHVLDRPEVRYAGIDRHWKHYKTKNNVGFEAYSTDSKDAIAGGGDFTELAHKFGLDPTLNAVGFGLGLLRIK